MTAAEHMDPHVGVLNQRVTSLEAGQNAIITKLDGLSSQLAERSRAPWGLIISVVGTGAAVIGAIFGLAVKPLSDGQARVEATMATISLKLETVDKAARDTFIGKGEFGTILSAIKDRRDDAQRVTEDRFKRIEADADSLQKAVVPRGELDEKFAGQRAHDMDVQRQLDELRARGEALYGPRDELTRLAREVDDLRGRLGRASP